MAVVGFTIEVDDITDVIRFYDRIRVYRNTTSAAGPFVEITTATTRIPLSPGQTRYEFYDVGGAPEYWYTVDYYSTLNGTDSGQSDPMQGARDPAFDILTPEELRRYYLFGLDLSDDQGRPFPDDLFEWYIKAAVARAERELDMPLRRRVFADTALNPAADAPELHADFIPSEWYKYFYVQLPEYPVISVESARLVLPNGQVAFDFPTSWFNLDRESGQLFIVPDGSVANLPTLGFSVFGWQQPVFGTARFVPGVYRVGYTAGLSPVPADIRDLVGMWASMGPLNVGGDLIVGAGIASQSLSMDGISQSVSTTSSATNAGYGARILAYTRQVKEMLPKMRQYYKGIRAVVA